MWNPFVQKDDCTFWMGRVCPCGNKVKINTCSCCNEIKTSQSKFKYFRNNIPADHESSWNESDWKWVTTKLMNPEWPFQENGTFNGHCVNRQSVIHWRHVPAISEEFLCFCTTIWNTSTPTSGYGYYQIYFTPCQGNLRLAQNRRQRTLHFILPKFPSLPLSLLS